MSDLEISLKRLVADHLSNNEKPDIDKTTIHYYNQSDFNFKDLQNFELNIKKH